MKPAVKRIPQMTDDELLDYIHSLDEDIRLKQEKVRRLSSDLNRQRNILSRAREEAQTRRLGPGV